MKAATVNIIKDELSHLPAKQLVTICIRLARFKKENKELLTYILFEENNIPDYIEQVKKEIDELFSSMNTSNLYFSKKTIRKAGRVTTKYIRYSLSKIVETELLLYYAFKIKDSGIPFKKSSALSNLYNNQLKKIRASLLLLHEDLQYDYLKQLDLLDPAALRQAQDPSTSSG